MIHRLSEGTGAVRVDPITQDGSRDVEGEGVEDGYLAHKPQVRSRCVTRDGGASRAQTMARHYAYSAGKEQGDGSPAYDPVERFTDEANSARTALLYN